MLHEILFSLLGFVGDIIVDDDSVFKVKDGFDLLQESERTLVNKIVPLGWYYVKLNEIIQRYDISWGQTSKPCVYLASAVQGMSDLLTEYVADVAYLEQLLLAEGPIPLSQVLQHMQKVGTKILYIFYSIINSLFSCVYIVFVGVSGTSQHVPGA